LSSPAKFGGVSVGGIVKLIFGVKMKHLDDIHMGYFKHLTHAWRMAFILIVHGLFPWVWETKVSDEIMSYHTEEME